MWCRSIGPRGPVGRLGPLPLPFGAETPLPLPLAAATGGVDSAGWMVRVDGVAGRRAVGCGLARVRAGYSL